MCTVYTKVCVIDTTLIIKLRNGQIEDRYIVGT